MESENTVSDQDTELDVIDLRAELDARNVRLDKFVADRVPDLSRTYLQTLIDQGLIRVDGQIRRASFKMTPGETVQIVVPEVQETELLAEDIPLDILHEDRDLLVINKPAGMVVHPAPGHYTGTLVNAVLHHAPDIAVAGNQRPGLVHRLDKDTSGVIVLAKTDRAWVSLTSQWQDRTVRKTYLALATGVLEEQEATVDAPVGRDPANRQRMTTLRGGRDAVSHFSVEQRFQKSTYLSCVIETGRTHQIRVHLAFIRKPIVGDIIYGTPKSMEIAADLGLKRQFLHAWKLGFRSPDGEELEFTAPLASDLQMALDRLREKEGVA
jgi:23S rRNA pseudouridine1911/1915/1917 synthase